MTGEGGLLTDLMRSVLQRGSEVRSIIGNQLQLERVVADYIEHDNTHRQHRSLEQRPPLPP